MGSGYELVLTAGPATRALTLGAAPVYVGRSPQSDLAVTDRRVSWQHFRVWVQDGVIRVTDLGSRNGTWVNDRRVLGTTTVSPGDSIRAADGIQLEVRRSEGAPEHTHYVVEEVESGLRYPFRDGAFAIGPDAGADLRVAGTHPTRIAFDEAALRLERGATVVPLQTGAVFEVGPLALRVRAVSVVPRSTAGDGSGGLLPYAVECALDPATAEVRAPGGLSLVRITGEAQTTLMWVLSAALEDDGGLAESDRGWRDEHHVIVRVWGRGGLDAGPNRLKVLLHRLRKLLRTAGVDPELIERRDGRIRLRAARTRLLG